MWASSCSLILYYCKCVCKLSDCIKNIIQKIKYIGHVSQWCTDIRQLHAYCLIVHIENNIKLFVRSWHVAFWLHRQTCQCMTVV